MRYAYIEASLSDPELQGISIAKRCEVFGISTSGYYDWIRRKNGTRPKAGLRKKVSDETVAGSLKNIRNDVGYTPGYRQSHSFLRDIGIRVDINRLRRIMRENGFVGYRPMRKKVATTNSKHDMDVCPNLLEREFAPGVLNRAWVTDITYLPTRHSFSYLVTFTDLGSRRVLGWAVDTAQTTKMVLNAFEMAVAVRTAEGISLAGTIVHSDRGTQYCSRAFQARVAGLNMRSSMSGVGQCWDNAPGESIWSSLKREVLKGSNAFTDHADAFHRVAQWLSVYNHRRPHSSIGMLSPINYESALSLSG